MIYYASHRLPTQHPGIKKILLFSFMGVVLPVIALCFDAFMHMSAQFFFDPIPTILHALLIAMVPLSNALLLRALSRSSMHHILIWAWLNAFTMGVSLLYTLLYLPLTHVAPLMMILFGFGFLPLAPLLAFIATVWARSLLKRMAAEQRAPAMPHAWGGLLLALIVMMVIELPVSVHASGIQLDAYAAAELQNRGQRLWNFSVEIMRFSGSMWADVNTYLFGGLPV